MDKVIDFNNYMWSGNPTVICYGYRGGVIRGHRVRVNRELAAVSEFETWLARKAGERRKDNHVIYRYQELNDDKPTFFWFTDMHLIIGFGIELETAYAKQVEAKRLELA